MIALQSPPVFKDSGYLYVAPVIVDSRGNKRPPVDLKPGFTVRYGTVDGTEYAVVRRPDPVTMNHPDVPIKRILEAAAASGADVSVLGRIRGR